MARLRGENRRREKENKSHNKNRPQNTRSERKMLIIACEDGKSSRLYFEDIFAILKKNHSIAASSLIIAKHQHTDPCGVLQDLCTHKGYENFEHKWIVIDRDEGGHTIENFEQALANAEKKKIKVAYSNPCFEIWVLLHFQYYEKKIDRYVLERYLKRYYQYEKSKLFSPMFNPERQKTAIKNAERLMKWRKGQGLNPATDNPSTTVHELVLLLNGFGK